MVDTIGTVPVTNFVRRRGDTYPFVLSLKDGAGAALDITGATFLLTIDPSPTPENSAANIAQLTGTIVGPATNGQVRFTPTAPAVGTLGVLFYDVQMTEAGGGIRTILVGQWSVEQDVTK
jgi:hypothetical protein